MEQATLFQLPPGSTDINDPSVPRLEKKGENTTTSISSFLYLLPLGGGGDPLHLIFQGLIIFPIRSPSLFSPLDFSSRQYTLRLDEALRGRGTQTPPLCPEARRPSLPRGRRHGPAVNLSC